MEAFPTAVIVIVVVIVSITIVVAVAVAHGRDRGRRRRRHHHVSPTQGRPPVGRFVRLSTFRLCLSFFFLFCRSQTKRYK